jgi:diadenosine tetraphosphate (Ap4A) HIT family hydrolase
MRQGQLSAYGSKLLRKIAYMPLMREIFVWGLINMNNFLPIQKISETDSLICFYHPQPVYSIHILLVPKDAIHDLSQIDFEESEFIRDLFMTVRTLITELELEQRGYRLILNGG